jgi:hypothetical protein
LFIAIAVYVPFWPGRFIPKSVAPVAGQNLEDKDGFNSSLK